MLDIENVTYHSGSFSLSDVSLHVDGGVAVGIVGLNGCGKTTLMRLITDLTPADAGEVRIFGKRVERLTEAEKQRIAIIDPDILYFKGYYGAAALAERLSEIYIEFNKSVYMQKLNLLGIPTNIPTSRLSRGQYERLLFAIALSCNSRLLLIDEACDGLDHENKAIVFDELKSFLLAGGAILFTSHTPRDVEAICDEVIFMDGGEIKLTLSKDEIKERYDIADVSDEEFSCIDGSAILNIKRKGYSSSVLVFKERVNRAFIKRKSSFSEIVELLIEYTRSRK